jgi:hypothetical protein
MPERLAPLDEIAILEARKDVILGGLANPQIEREQFMALVSELAEVDTALQKQYGPLDTLADAKLCARFGQPL